MTQHTETEVKLYVPDLFAVTARLEAAGASLAVPRVYERNVRYEDVRHTLSPRGIVLRLRQDNGVRLTYKDAGRVERGILSRTEMEVEVSDFATMDAILLKIGFVQHMIYEKYRTTYRLNDAEIVLDEMPFGHFVEIEGSSEVIEQLIPALGLEGAPRLSASYAALFDRVRHRLKLRMQHLTFDAFKGVPIPEDMFTS